MGGLDTEDRADGGLDPRRFGALHAVLAYFLVLLGQFAAGFAVVLAYVIASLGGGADLSDARVMTSLIQRSLVPLIIASSLATVLITLVLVRAWAWHLVRDRSAAGLGLFVPPARTLVLCAVTGAVLGGVFLLSTQFIQTDFRGGGPLAKVAMSGPVGRALWAVLAVLIAPPVEELLFRGLMLRGMMASWGVTAAGIVVTILFFVLHLFEAAGYWPAMIAIITLSVVTLIARLRTGSVVAATVVHAAYNAALSIAVYAT